MSRLALLFIVLALGACSGADVPAKRIVLVTLDTLRQDSYASHMPRTMERASRGRSFERYYSATSTTQPTHATLFTGQHPWRHGVSRNGMVLGEHHETIVERMHDAGYRTAAVVASFPVGRTFRFDQGFDRYHDRFNKGSLEGRAPDEIGGEPGEEAGDDHFFSGARYVLRHALEALDELGGEKQFFWFHFFDPHPPYGDSGGRSRRNPGWIITRIREGHAPAAAVLDEARAGYDADVEHLDAALGRLLDRLDDGVETHVVVVSDHGESFGEFGSLGHGERLTPEQIRVPCFILSDRVEPGVVSVPTGTVDLTATLLSLADLDASAETGRDLTAARLAPAPIYGMRRTFGAPTVEVRVDLSQHAIGPADHRFFLVDGESYFVGDEERVWRGDGAAPVGDAATEERLRTFFAVCRQELEGASIDELTDEETLRTLRELGYVQ